jgi:DNA invertase Pin-like site-specific DNA recombinase
VLCDSFTDEGYSARNFDRPDLKALFEFIKKNHSSIDYLVVSELTRFSRELGDAINTVKRIQLTYGIRIVSASRNAIYDCTNDQSFFMMGLEFMMGNSENIKRANDINGGIYTAKAIEGRYIHGKAPFGYKIEGTGKSAKLVIDEPKAYIIRYVYESFLRNVPQYIIFNRAKEMGLNMSGNSTILDILQKPIYSGQQFVKEWKDKAGGMFKANHEPIIDILTWNAVQVKLKGNPNPKIAVSDDFPLRGVLKCHCQQPLTGAPSRSRNGKYYNYYKCNRTSHLNLSAKKAHDQLNQILQLMSLPIHLVNAVMEASEKILNERTKNNRNVLADKRRELEQVKANLISVEEKFITNQVTQETYYRWFQEYTGKQIVLRGEIEKLSRNENELWLLFRDNLRKLTDLLAIFNMQSVPEKQETLRMVFDNSLYYRTDRYRTTFIMPVFSHNQLLLSNKQLLEVDQPAGQNGENPLRWSSPDHNRTIFEPLADLLYLISHIKTA